MQEIQGGEMVDEFCNRFAIASGAYVLGAALNWWNPVGWTGGIVLGGINLACAFV